MTRRFWYPFLILPLLVGCGGRTQEDVFTGLAEGRTVMVPALVGGKLVALYVEEGDEVSAGDTVAVLDTLELALKKKQLLATMRELEVQLRIARSNLNRVADELSYAKQRFARVQALHQQGAATDQAFDDVQNAVARAERAYEAARLQLEALRVKREELVVQLELVNKKIVDSVVLTPKGGVVTQRLYEPGEAVAPYRPIVEITQTDPIRVKIYVPEQFLPHVKPGNQATVRVDGLQEQLRGTVSWVSPSAEFTPKTILTPETRASLVYAVEIRVPNPDGILKDGMPVEVVLE